MKSDNMQEKRNQSGGYVSPELNETAVIAPERGFASSEVGANSPAKWVVGNEDWWNE